MFRIDDPTALGSLPTPEAAGTQGYFTEGNPGTGTPATLVRASFLNMLQEELMSLLAAAGITASKTTYSQILTALRSAGVFQTAAASTNDTTAATTGFVFNATHGITNINVAGAADVTVTVAQAGLPILALTGVLTGNIGLILPGSETGEWIVINNSTGAFTITAKYATGSGVILAQGTQVNIVADGTNVNYVSGTSLGVGQTWQDLTGSRAINTNFTNSTGRPISVTASVAGSVATSTVTASWTIAGVSGIASTTEVTNGTPANTVLAAGPITIPAGATYQLAVTNGTLSSWKELR